MSRGWAVRPITGKCPGSCSRYEGPHFVVNPQANNESKEALSLHQSRS